MRPVFCTNNVELFEKAWHRLYDGGIPTIPPYAFLPWQMPWQVMQLNTMLPREKMLATSLTSLNWKKTWEMFGKLHVCLDWQYDEAVNILQDPSYIVKNPINMDEFEQVLYQMSSIYEKLPKLLDEKILKWCFAFDAFIGAVYVVFTIIIN